jgi:hypothetical protein
MDNINEVKRIDDSKIGDFFKHYVNKKLIFMHTYNPNWVYIFQRIKFTFVSTTDVFF